MWQWLIKLIGGWIPNGSKPFGEYIGKIIWAVGIYVACTYALSLLAPKNTTTIASGATQIIQQAEPKDTIGIGCNVFRLYLRGGIRGK